MGITPDQFVDLYVARMSGKAMDIDRLVTEPCGLAAAGMMAVLGHPGLGRLGIPFMADVMKPEGSIYFDAIFGAYSGQAAIRAWLLPAMASIGFIDFVPMAEPVLFDDGEGGTSLDEWQMVATIEDRVSDRSEDARTDDSGKARGEIRIPLSRGVSVRRFRDGWITWACDVYDTGPMRQPPPTQSGVEAAPLPPCPRVAWATDTSGVTTPLSSAARAWVESRTKARGGAGPTLVETVSGLSHQDLHDVLNDPATGSDFNLLGDMCHPTDSVYIDPIFGEFRGQTAIRTWLNDVMAKVGNLAFEPVGPVLFDGTTSAQEWKQMAVLPDGNRVMMMRGTSVRRFVNGWLVYAADYFDTAALGDPEVLAASQAAGSTITIDDVLRYRNAQPGIVEVAGTVTGQQGPS